MKIFIIGANGRVASELSERLVSAGHTIYAGVRDLSKVEETEKVKPISFNLHDSVADLAKSLRGMDVIYFLAGSRGKDLLQTDAFGAVKSMQAAQLAGIKRYIMLSSLFATEPEKWNQAGLDQLTDYNIAKFFADNYLVYQTDLDYTILQPGGLAEEAGTGLVTFAPEKVGRNPIPDVAEVLAKIIQYPNTKGKIIQMLSGTESIDAGMAKL
ncbi:SDR family oxidoreductase [Streptococcus tangpeifui]|uniref:SDR family oxidoreductase n=1 Tax=Streptococcus tangpeifui TaxID=2709400 RepID=UPI0013E9A848|nr:SDR family oxidoreductase [Streptococcus sp. ZJ1593]